MDISIHPSMDRHLGFLQFEALANKAAMNVCTNVCKDVFFHFSEYLRVGYLGYVGGVCSSF